MPSKRADFTGEAVVSWSDLQAAMGVGIEEVLLTPKQVRMLANDIATMKTGGRWTGLPRGDLASASWMERCSKAEEERNLMALALARIVVAK